jgi:hypothetical protein
MYSKGGRGIISVSAQQGWERDSLCMCTARVGEGFSLYVYSKGGRGILSVSAQQGWERDSLCMCTARVGEGLSL